MEDVAETGGPDPITRLRRYAAILNDFARLAAEVPEKGELLGLAAVQAARGIGIRHAKVMRYRPDRGDLLLVAGVGWRPGVVGQAVLGADLASPPGLTLRTRQPLVVDDLREDPNLRLSELLRSHGIVSALNVPVLLDGDVWGVMEVDSHVPRHFGDDDAQFLLALAGTLGLGLGALGRAAPSGDPEALAEARTLLRELQHRSKNDLQLILALLVAQRRKVSDETARRLLTYVMDRITTIGVAHDQLSHGARTGMIALSDYLAALCGNLTHRREGVTIATDLDPVSLPHAQAVPIGLIVNELVTNALKHAFPDRRTGTVRVALRAERETGEAVLSVGDDGVGLGPPRPGSSGSDLVRRLARQVGGRLEIPEVELGTTFRLTLPLVP